MGEGTGLGLATVYGILMQNGGIVDAQSGIGRGTTVSLHIPSYTGSGPVEEKTVFAHAQKGGGETVLLVEDELTLLRMGRRMLETFGYRVLAAGGAEEAMALAAGHQGEIHLLLTDVLMPGMDGKELSKRLLASRPDMKCLFISGHTADTMARQGIIDMGTNFIQKPFKLHDFAAAVRAALDSAE